MLTPTTLGEGNDSAREYADVAGFCKSASVEEIRRHSHVLTPGRYVGAEPQPDDGEPFQEKMARLTIEWREQQEEAGGWMPPLRKTWNGWGLEVALDCHRFPIRYQVPRGWQP